MKMMQNILYDLFQVTAGEKKEIENGKSGKLYVKPCKKLMWTLYPM